VVIKGAPEVVVADLASLGLRAAATSHASNKAEVVAVPALRAALADAFYEVVADSVGFSSLAFLRTVVVDLCVTGDKHHLQLRTARKLLPRPRIRQPLTFVSQKPPTDLALLCYVR
jgi:hypothetical protein